jgi:superfamily II DNA/RNA helicase
MTKGKQGELQTHGSLIGHHLSRFLHMSEIEMVVMTEENMMVGMTVVS